MSSKIIQRINNELARFPFRIGRLIKIKVFNVFKGAYLSYIPDRYSFNYKKQLLLPHNFYDPKNIEAWVKKDYVNNAGDLVRFFFITMVVEQIIKENIKGDVAELGVYKGNSASLLAQYVRKFKKKLYLFDTFAGFDERDLIGKDVIFKKTTFSNTSLEAVKLKVGEENVEFIQGYFPESLSQIKDEDGLEFSLVHIDCDLEKPISDSLAYFYPKMSTGGFLIIHDYSSLNWDGATTAVDNFFKDKVEKIIPIPDKSGTVVIRKI